MFNNSYKLNTHETEAMVRVVVDNSKCIKDTQKICVEVCPVSIFRLKKSGRPQVVNEENCVMCRTCQVNCPEQAIKILP